MTNTLHPLEEPFSPEIEKALAVYPRQSGYLLSLFRTFANSLRFLERCVPNLLDKDSPLPLRIREIVILRITANNNCEYEWGVHVSVFSKAAQLTEAQIEATCLADIDARQWANDEANLLEAIDQLCAKGSMDDATLETFQQDWTREQQLEILALCGTYHMISFVANTARLPSETFAKQMQRRE